MNMKEVLRLLDAGFTKDDIMTIVSSADNIPSASEAAAAHPAAEASGVKPEDAPAAAEPAPAAEPDIYQMISDKIDAKFNEMAEAFKMPAMPSMGEIKPLGIDDIVRKFFKED